MSRNINIFAKPTFLNVSPGRDFKFDGNKPKRGHLMRVSSMIRGDQIADRIGANLNPETVKKDDVCIYVKPMVRKGDDFNFEGKAYLDIIDGHNLGNLLQKHPNVTCIVCSQADFLVMSKVLTNRIINIPQHHCNFDRVKRNRKGVKRIGVIGTREAFPFLPKGLKKDLESMKIELVEFSNFFTRQDIIDFYLSIDLQIVWRPYKKILSNPLKIVNAASFGIPTVALDEPAFSEVEGAYLPVIGYGELLTAVETFKNHPEMYDRYSLDCLDIAERYHIDVISKMYKELANG